MPLDRLSQVNPYLNTSGILIHRDRDRRECPSFSLHKKTPARETEQGEGPDDVAKSLNVSRRTLYRALAALSPC